MRHNNKVNHLGKKTGHRSAMLSNMATSLILHKRIETTLAKAKVLRGYVEPLITKAKNDTTHSRRTTFAYLKNKHAVKELFSTVADKVGQRPGGYTRILKIGFRQGDAAEMAMIELVDFNETYTPTVKKEKKKTTRRAGGAKKAATASKEEVTVEETPVEEVPKSEDAAVPKAKKAKVDPKAKAEPAETEEPKSEE
ncbi:MAG: 50S ribosomal protein L17 [Prevotellaceae bacterium]|jgi:large subunit ribosomal protein L17|nr:50S ribosomal protein L17 [Prevotellaceae bacterium]